MYCFHLKMLYIIKFQVAIIMVHVFLIIFLKLIKNCFKSEFQRLSVTKITILLSIIFVVKVFLKKYVILCNLV